MNQETLLKELIQLTIKNMEVAKDLKNYNLTVLNWKKNSNSWSTLQCIEHLNLYGEFYLPEIEESILKNKFQAESFFKSGFIGNRLAKSMFPGDKMRKTKTSKSMYPSDKKLNNDILEIFVNQQEQLLKLLDLAKNVSLNRNRVSISMAKCIKLKLGDVLKVIIYHNRRHIVQASKALQAGLPLDGIIQFDSFIK
ncbi:DinB superfamily protein [Arenibacter palladensis]|uniref:DinB superfamily protein n=1 Tax=Arenibacter palladensis TaxID=237373 RepID=A0A1M4Y149_9FLAO|nr:DinB family protein [Arenibacter palladensis]SHE99419.1 DinB superfamily protein [Arenibacter palladensis]